MQRIIGSVGERLLLFDPFDAHPISSSLANGEGAKVQNFLTVGVRGELAGFHPRNVPSARRTMGDRVQVKFGMWPP
jgi:hypothetical protein